MRKKSRRTGSVYCCEVINTAAWRGSAGAARRWRCPLPPRRLRASPGADASACRGGHSAGFPWNNLQCLLYRSTGFFLMLCTVYRHPCVFPGPFKSNIAIDLCAPGSLCTQRQTGIFSRVCSRSRKNSQMGIILTLYISWTLLTHNAAQNE